MKMKLKDLYKHANALILLNRNDISGEDYSAYY